MVLIGRYKMGPGPVISAGLCDVGGGERALHLEMTWCIGQEKTSCWGVDSLGKW